MNMETRHGTGGIKTLKGLRRRIYCSQSVNSTGYFITLQL
ncbi:hypothetical protein E2C01_013330 [Portunus trituberculatus]|uniref:Uncharacterized protein n=1 Tax=Portunus trituberculatus TaxID=210409 RepID=A0A5B7DGC4_PORTR|nr:hypothetical protein [Portunus trituberculatus]